MNKKVILAISVVLLLILAGAAYWYFLFEPGKTPTTSNNPDGTSGGFSPFDNTPIGSISNNNNSATTTATTTEPVVTTTKIPTLRLLSSAPVGGYGLSATTSTTLVRWVDRGRGNIYETLMNKPDTTILSNTLVPRIYESWWNRDASTFFAQYISDESDTVTTATANLLKTKPQTQATTTDTSISETPYQLKGKIISGNIIGIAVSPKKDKILTIIKENTNTVGYISNFDSSKPTQVFSLPLTQINVEWPEENTIAITTKGSSAYAGFLYFVNIKTGAIKQIIGNQRGLSTKVNSDATKVFYSYTGSSNDRISNAIFDIKTNKTSNVIFRALADKCVWSSKFKEDFYCAVPSQIPAGTYPDDWYAGKISFVDTIWQYNASTNQGNQIINLIDQSTELIDAYNLGLDNNDQYLLFVNKTDLSLWALDLVSTE